MTLGRLQLGHFLEPEAGAGSCRDEHRRVAVEAGKAEYFETSIFVVILAGDLVLIERGSRTKPSLSSSVWHLPGYPTEFRWVRDRL